MPHILIVEDDPKWMEVVQETCGLFEGVELTIARDYGGGMEAINTLGPFDLLIFDNTLGSIRDASIELLQVAHRRLRPMPPSIVHSADLTVMTEQAVNQLGAVYAKKFDCRLGEVMQEVLPGLTKRAK